MGRPARKFTEEEINKVRELAEQEKSRFEIEKETGICFIVLTRLMKENNIEIKNYSGRRPNKYGLDRHYFDVIDTPNKAWITGFLFADGVNESTGHRVTINIKEDDECILEMIKKELGCIELPIIHRTVNSKTLHGEVYHGEYKSSTLRLDSYEISARLKEIGMVPCKSLIVEFPIGIPDELMRHFIRGYFDGNGNITQHHGISITNRVSIICGSEKFCIQMKEYTDKLGIKSQVNFNHKNSNAKKWETTNIHGILTFLHHIYDDCELYLPRKKQQFLDFCAYYERDKE